MLVIRIQRQLMVCQCDDQIHMFVWNSSVVTCPVSVSQRNQLFRHVSTHKGVSSDLDHYHEIFF